MRFLLALWGLLCVAASVRTAAVKAVEDQAQDVPKNETALVSLDARFASCPTDWHSYQGSCYLLVNSRLSWSSAEAHCAGQETSLASAHSFWEYSFLQQLARTVGHSDVWLGGFYFDGKWRWEDNTDLNYNNWYTQHSPTSCPCIFLNTYASRGWSNSVCSTSRPFICSRRTTMC